MMFIITTVALSAWTLPSPHVRVVQAPLTRAAVSLKAAPDERPEERPEINIKAGNIVEFHDPKHGNSKCAAVLGLVEGAEYKAKGGARIMIVDANGDKHAVKESAIHINLGSYKGKQVEPHLILADFSSILEMEATDFGVDPADLEMAWELCAETDQSTFSPKSIASLIDESLCNSPVDLYKTFRLLTSDLGKLFFKPINDHEYKAKAFKAVQASKEAWCREHTELEYCLV